MKDEWKYKNTLIERLKNKAGLRGRVDAHCVQCVYDPAVEGTWRQQVEACEVLGCPLWEVRARSRSES